MAIRVAIAEPAMPMRGAGPSPRMKTGFKPLSSTTATIMNHKGVRLSPAPRSAIISSVSSSIARHGEEDHAQIGERERRRFGRACRAAGGSQADK